MTFSLIQFKRVDPYICPLFYFRESPRYDNFFHPFISFELEISKNRAIDILLADRLLNRPLCFIVYMQLFIKIESRAYAMPSRFSRHRNNKGRFSLGVIGDRI